MLKIGGVFLAITGAMWLIFNSAQWYADHAALPRYCDDPHTTVQLVGQILTSKTPVEDDNRRPYVIAAKLIFLVPRGDNEPLQSYLGRLRGRISQTCGTILG